MRAGVPFALVALLVAAGAVAPRDVRSDAAPRCFGAAARDPQKPCRNPELRLSVVPTPRQARERPNAPCTLTRTRPFKICEFGVSAARATATVALIGDSHASHWRAALEVVSRAKNWHGLSITRSRCPLSLAPRNVPEPDRRGCTRWRQRVLSWLGGHPEIATVFVSELSGGGGVVPVNGEDQATTATRGYVDAWNALPAAVTRVVVIRDDPKVLAGTDECVERAIRERRPAGGLCAVARTRALTPDPAIAAARLVGPPRIQTVDLTAFFCGPLRCYPVIGGALVHKDVGHMTVVYSRTLGPYLLRAIDALGGS